MEIKLPCYDSLKLVPIEQLQANDYNPNKMDRRMFELLKKSIVEDGLTMPIVTYHDKENDKYIIVDGFHRYSTLLKLGVKKVPISIIDKNISKRKISTIRHNKAKGTHQLDLVAKVLKDLMADKSMSYAEIMDKLGMIAEEVVIYDKEFKISNEFDDVDFSNSWSRDHDKEAELYHKVELDELLNEYEED